MPRHPPCALNNKHTEKHTNNTQKRNHTTKRKNSRPLYSSHTTPHTNTPPTNTTTTKQQHPPATHQHRQQEHTQCPRHPTAHQHTQKQNFPAHHNKDKHQAKTPSITNKLRPSKACLHPKKQLAATHTATQLAHPTNKGGTWSNQPHKKYSIERR